MIIRIFLILFLCHFQLTAQWNQTTDFPSNERDDGTVFVIGSKAYCGSGLSSWWAPFGDFYSFDINTETWTAIAPLPVGEERQYATGFASESSGFIFGGINGSTYLSDLWKYDTLSNTWSEISSSFPGVGRSGSCVFVINDTAYIIGGRMIGVNAMSEVWAYDINNDTWTSKSNLPFGGRWRASAASMNNKGYLIFGSDVNDTMHNEIYEYDTYSDSWTQIGTFPLSGRTYSSLNVINDKLYVAFGMDSADIYFNDIREFDTQNSSWSSLNSLPDSGRKGGMTFSYGQTLYYTCGITESGVRLKQTWKYNVLNFVEESKDANKLIIYPNPIEKENTLHINADCHGFNYKIIDAKGVEILSGLCANTTCQIDFSPIKPGIYILQISESKNLYLTKVVKIN